MLAYYCPNCRMYYRLEELLRGKRCPDCHGDVKPRLVLAGQMIGAD